MKTIAPIIGTPELVEQTERYLPLVRQMERQKGKNKAQVLAQMKLRSAVNEVFEQLAEKAKEFDVNIGAIPTLKDAVKSGLLSIHEFRSLPPGAVLDYKNPEFIANIVAEFIQELRKAVEDGQTYPLLDEQAGTMVSLLATTGQISPSEAAELRGRSVALASHLFHRLPTFERASISELLDIRRELEKPLLRFRAGMLTLSSKMAAAAWDEEFPEEAEILTVQEVEPAILEIEDQVKSNAYLTQLVRDIADKPLMPVGGTFLSLVVAPVAQLPELVARGVLAGGVAAFTALNALANWRSAQRKTEGNQLYFYYRLQKRL
jgi:hypothetical protein